MYCNKCGAQNDDNALNCIKCGSPLKPPAPGAPPLPTAPPNIPNYLVQSILVTLLCCLPLGIVAIVYAASVNGKIQAQDYNGAMEASNKAKLFCWIGFGVGLAGILVYAILMVIGLAAGVHGQ